MRLGTIMSQVEIPYEDAKQKMIEEIQKHHRMYLATSDGDFVTVRRMGPIPDGLTVWFQTGVNSRKYEHLVKNSNVALAAGDDLQIEGVASLRGHPLDDENSDFIKVFKENRPEMYERSIRPGRILQRPSTRLIEVTPRRIALSVWTANWDLEPDFEPYVIILNTVEEKAYRIKSMELDKAPAYRE